MAFPSIVFPPNLAYSCASIACPQGQRTIVLFDKDYFIHFSGNPLKHCLALALGDAVLDAVVDLGEARSLTGLAVPAATHQRVDGERRVVRTAEYVALLDVFDHLLVG